MRQKRQWYVVPMAVLAIAVVAAGFILWRIVTKGSDGTAVNSATNTERSETPASCGNGTCENVACLSTNCPTPESEENCPEDCLPRMEDNASLPNENSNVVNSNANRSNGLSYGLSSQTDEQKAVCPVSDANLSPDRAVEIARTNGMTQGTRNLAVRFYPYGLPIDQCVWEVRSYLTASSGRVVVVIDSTQEVYDSYSWKGQQ